MNKLDLTYCIIICCDDISSDDSDSDNEVGIVSVSSSSASNLPSASGSGSSVVSGVIAPVVAEVQPIGSSTIFKHEESRHLLKV